MTEYKKYLQRCIERGFEPVDKKAFEDYEMLKRKRKHKMSILKGVK